MDSRRTIAAAVLAVCGLLAPGCTPGGDGSPKDVASPLAVGSEQAFGYVALPSTGKVIDDMVAVAGLFAPPGEVTVQKLKEQLGVLLGDPGLKSFDLSRPVVLAVFKPEAPGAAPPVALFLPAGKAVAESPFLKQAGLQGRVAGKLLLVAQTTQALDLVEKNAGIYQQIAGADVPATARLYVDVERFWGTYRSMAEGMLELVLQKVKGSLSDTAQPGLDPELTMAIFEAEMRGVLSLVKQCREVQVDIGLDGDTVMIHKTVVARAGSNLAKFFSASAVQPPVSRSVVAGKGILAGAFRCDSESFGTFCRALVEDLAKSPSLAKLVSPEAISLMSDAMSVSAGKGSFRLYAGTDGGLLMDGVMHVRDGAKYLELVEKSAALLQPGGGLDGLLKMYKDAGMEFSGALEKDARRHDGVSVHRFRITWNLSGGKEPGGPQAEMVRAMLSNKGFLQGYELAVIGNAVVFSCDAARMDALIDAVQSKTERALEIVAQTTFGRGCHAYMDYDIFGLLKGLLGSYSRPGGRPLQMEVFARMSPEPPMTFGATFGKERVLVEAAVPLEPWAKLAREIEKAAQSR